jgi:hypothetical protein
MLAENVREQKKKKTHTQDRDNVWLEEWVIKYGLRGKSKHEAFKKSFASKVQSRLSKNMQQVSASSTAASSVSPEVLVATAAVQKRPKPKQGLEHLCGTCLVLIARHGKCARVLLVERGCGGREVAVRRLIAGVVEGCSKGGRGGGRCRVAIVRYEGAAAAVG